MATIHLTADLLAPGDPPRSWPDRLSEAGLLADVSDPDPASPLDEISKLQDTLGLLLEAEKIAESTTTFEPPQWVWWVIGGALLCIILFAEALVASFGPSVIWVGLAFAAGVALFTLYDRNQRKADAHTQVLEARLKARLTDLLGRNFVVRLGGHTLVSTPDLDALMLLADATAISDPDAEITQRITAQIARLQADVEKLIRRPGDWRRQDLGVDLDEIQRQLDALPSTSPEEPAS